MPTASTVFTMALRACHTSILGLILGMGMLVLDTVVSGSGGLAGAGDHVGPWASVGVLHISVLAGDGVLLTTAMVAGVDTPTPDGGIILGDTLIMDTATIIMVGTVTR